MNVKIKVLPIIGMLIWVLIGPAVISLSLVGIPRELGMLEISICLAVSLSALLYYYRRYTSLKKKLTKQDEDDEEYSQEIQEVKLRINLILAEIRMVATEKGIDEERLKYHCSYFMGGKSLSDLNLEEVVLFRSYIKSLNEVIATEQRNSQIYN